jgi:hypothetical protein
VPIRVKQIIPLAKNCKTAASQNRQLPVFLTRYAYGVFLLTPAKFLNMRFLLRITLNFEKWQRGYF